MSPPLEIAFPSHAITLANPEAALAFRGSLPGAFTFDRVADLFRGLQAQDTPAIALLPSALPAAWLVNAQATSRTFSAWLRDHSADWESVLALLPFEAAIYDLDGLDRGAIEAAFARLLLAEGATFGSITKVLALLRPQLVPIFHDAVVAGITGTLPMPTKDDSETAGVATFFPLLEAFQSAVLAHDAELIDLARTYALAPLDAPQVLDRLLWWHFCGRRYDPSERDPGVRDPGVRAASR